MLPQWASSDEDEQEEEEGWVRPKRARRGVADLAAGPPAAPPAGPSQYQQRRLAAQQLQLEVVEVAGVAARMVACVAAACGEPVLPDTLGMLPGAADAQRAAATPQQPMSYAQLLMQELPEEGGSPTVASATDPPRVSRFGRTVRPSVHRTGGLAAAALALEAPAPRPSSGRPGRPPRSAVYAADGGLAPLLSDDAEPQEDKVCVECGTREYLPALARRTLLRRPCRSVGLKGGLAGACVRCEAGRGGAVASSAGAGAALPVAWRATGICRLVARPPAHRQQRRGMLQAVPAMSGYLAHGGASCLCVTMRAGTTPLWRTINGLTYCNADGEGRASCQCCGMLWVPHAMNGLLAGMPASLRPAA